jgi:hypothetical protein
LPLTDAGLRRARCHHRVVLRLPGAHRECFVRLRALRLLLSAATPSLQRLQY